MPALATDVVVGASKSGVLRPCNHLWTPLDRRGPESLLEDRTRSRSNQKLVHGMTFETIHDIFVLEFRAFLSILVGWNIMLHPCSIPFTIPLAI